MSLRTLLGKVIKKKESPKEALPEVGGAARTAAQSSVELSSVRDFEAELPEGQMKCRVCGCTDDCACPGGCRWVEPNLCSKCAGKENQL